MSYGGWQAEKTDLHTFSCPLIIRSLRDHLINLLSITLDDKLGHLHHPFNLCNYRDLSVHRKKLY